MLQRLFLTIALIFASKIQALSFTERFVDGINARFIDIADINQDGWNDILAITTDGSVVYWYQNNQNGTFTPRIVTNKAGIGARAAKVIDLDENGNIDVVVTSDSDTSIYWYQNTGHEVFNEVTITSSAGNANSLDVADVDNDNDYDLIVTTLDIDFINPSIIRSKVYFYENNGAESFPSPVIVLDSNNRIENAIAVNISSQFDKDLVLANTGGNILRRFVPSGGTYVETTSIDSPVNGVTGLYAIDLDRDGDMDILSASQNDDTVRWHINNNQSFSTQPVHSSADGAIDVHAGDMDNDGDIDIASASFLDGSVYVYENNGFNQFTSDRLQGNTTSAASVFVADMNNDGGLDVVSAAATGVRWHENNNPDLIFRSNFD